MQTGRFKVITAKLRRFIEIDEEEAIKGTIKFGRREREPDEAGNRFSRSPNFLIPVPPSERPVSAEGRVAFHFKHTFVVKKARYSNSTALSTGTLLTSGDKESFTTDAGNHERYISRESAVAAITPGDYDQYIEAGGMEKRSEAVFTNIDSDLERRVEFWNAVTRSERTPSPDVVTLHVERLPAHRLTELFDAATTSSQLSSLSRVYQNECLNTKKPASRVKCELEYSEFAKLRKSLRESDDWIENDPPITIKRGRGGRVQRRIVSEFPVGLDDAARIRIAGQFLEWLGSQGVMYTGVIHEPDHHNDARNHHFHAALYDRPCRYLPEHDCWDFEYREPVEGQHKRTRATKRQKKVAAFTRSTDGRDRRKHGSDLLVEMRKKFADLCNVELQALGINRLFDHRSFAEMGIKQKPGKHLGTRAASLEAAGVPTSQGIENAERSWQGSFDRAEENYLMQKRMQSDVRAHAGETLSRLLERGLANPVVGELDSLIKDFDRRVELLEDEELELARLHLTQEMAYSRADKTAEVCNRLVEAIENGNASKSERAEEANIRARLQLAEDHAERIWDATAKDVQLAGHLAQELFAEKRQLEGTIQSTRNSIEVAEELLLQDKRRRLEMDMYARKEHSYDFGKRYDRQIAAYFEAPQDFEDKWDRAFMRIQYEDLEIRPPSEKVPNYHVVGISREDLERLTHPFFKKRSQARLQAMLEIREMNHRRKLQRGQRAETRSADAVKPTRSEPAQTVLSSDHSSKTAGLQATGKQPVVGNSLEELPTHAESHYRQLQDEAALRRQADQDEAILEFMSWFEEEYAGQPFPVMFENGNLHIEIEQLPADRRQFADVFSVTIAECISEKLNPERVALRHLLLGTDSPLVELEGKQVIYDVKDRRLNVGPNAHLLLQNDPEVREYITEHVKLCAKRDTSVVQRNAPKDRDQAVPAAVVVPSRANRAEKAITAPEEATIIEQAWHASQGRKGR